jgi:radical SAM protein
VPKPDYDERPILVFWETTKACLLSCKHCRAEAIDHPLPGELSRSESHAFIQSLGDFGKPYPVLILTGGDPLMKQGIFDIISAARERDIPVGFSPSVTPNLNAISVQKLKELGVSTVSVSLDGATPHSHEGIRGVSNHFVHTLDAMKLLVSHGFKVQVNTTVMKNNVLELPLIAKILKETGVSIWEVFFLIKVGRGTFVEEIPRDAYEDVMHFLYDASKYDLIVRTVEAPFFRRVVSWRKAGELPPMYAPGALYAKLSTQLKQLLGEPSSSPRAQSVGTRDGKGVVFVAHDGSVYPSGFLPYSLGNIRTTPLVRIYRESPILRAIRNAAFRGRCGVCEYRDDCGGSRARAYAAYGDLLAEDPACVYAPATAGQFGVSPTLQDAGTVRL